MNIITARDIYDDGDDSCIEFRDGFDSFLSLLIRTGCGFYQEIPGDFFNEHDKKHPKWKKYLIKHDFIEEDAPLKVGVVYHGKRNGDNMLVKRMNEDRWNMIDLSDYTIAYSADHSEEEMKGIIEQGYKIR